MVVLFTSLFLYNRKLSEKIIQTFLHFLYFNIIIYLYSRDTHYSEGLCGPARFYQKSYTTFVAAKYLKIVFNIFDIKSVKIRDIHTDSLQQLVLIVFDTNDTIGGYQKYKRGD